MLGFCERLTVSTFLFFFKKKKLVRHSKKKELPKKSHQKKKQRVNIVLNKKRGSNAGYHQHVLMRLPSARDGAEHCAC